MAYSRPSSYPYPRNLVDHKGELSPIGVKEHLEQLYRSMLENDSRGEYAKDKDTDIDLKELIVRPEWYGAKGDGVTDDTAAIQAAVTVCPLGGTVMLSPAKTYLLNDPVIISKLVCINLNGAIVLGPTHGFAFEIRTQHFIPVPILADGASIIGSGSSAKWWDPANDTGSVIRLRVGSAGAILNVDSDRVRIQNVGLDLSDLDGVLGIHHLGGWYNNFKNVLVSGENGTGAYGLKIESTWTAETPTAEGAGGVFICTYENIICKNVYANGTPLVSLTTLNFIQLSCATFHLEWAHDIHFSAPVVQQSGGNFFEFVNANNITLMGGDFEGDGTLYACSGAVHRLTSIGNAIWQNGWPTSPIIYFSGTPYNSLLLDDFGYHLGNSYTTDDFYIGRNLRLTSATTATLTDSGSGGSAAILDLAGNFRVARVGAGTGYRTLTNMLDMYSDASAQLTLEGKAGASGNPYFKMIDGRTGGRTWSVENGKNIGEFNIVDSLKGTILSILATVPGISSNNRLDMWGSQFKLHGTDAVGFIVEDTGGDISFLQLVSGANAWNVETNREGAGVFGILQGGVGTRLVIDTSGNVGINNVAPAEKLDVNGNINVTGVYKVDDVQVVGAQAAAQSDLKADYTTGDLDSEAEVIAAINAQATAFNTLLGKQRTHGLIAT